jgi:hypothetical protein
MATQPVYVRDFGLIASKEDEHTVLYRRDCADSSTDPELVYRAALVDTSKFGPGWDFSNSFKKSAEIAILYSESYSELYFKLLSPSTDILCGLQAFTHSQHLPVNLILTSYKVPKFLSGFKSEQTPYARAVRRLQKRNLMIVLDGVLKFERDSIKSVGNVGDAGTLEVSAYLPRYDYLSDYLKTFF